MNTHTLASLIRMHAAQRPDHPVLHFQGQTLTYRDVDLRSNRVAHALRECGVQPGTRVAVLDTNSPEVIEILFGAAKCGAIPVPINWRLSPCEIAQIITDAQASVFLVSDEFYDCLQRIRKDIAHVTTVRVIGRSATDEHSFESWLSHSSDEDTGFDSDRDAIAMQLYTSGTTGLPKGVMIIHANILGHLDQMAAGWGYTPETVALTAMPLFHIAGTGGMLLCLVLGGTTVLHREVDLAAIIADVPAHQVTHIFLVPTVLKSLTELPQAQTTDWTSLQTFLYGAAPISETLLIAALKVLQCQFVQAYGLTECSGTAVQLAPEHHDPIGQPGLLRSCGRPLPWTQVRIVDPATGHDCTAGDVGELWIRSPGNMAGYWNNPQATAEVLTPEGWLRSGDAGYLGPDGFLYLHDRIKDMIVSGAENIYPAEVENVLAAHPDVSDATVIGVPHEHWGETPLAVVVAKPGSVLTSSEVIEFCRAKLAHFKCPTRVEFAETLPRNPSGKVLKRDLRARYWLDQTRKIH